MRNDPSQDGGQDATTAGTGDMAASDDSRPPTADGPADASVASEWSTIFYSLVINGPPECGGFTAFDREGGIESMTLTREGKFEVLLNRACHGSGYHRTGALPATQIEGLLAMMANHPCLVSDS